MNEKSKRDDSVYFLIYLVLSNTFQNEQMLHMHFGIVSMWKILQIQQEGKFVLPC